MSNDSNSKWKKNLVGTYLYSVIVHNTSRKHRICIYNIWLQLMVNKPIHIEGMVYLYILIC